MESRHWSMKGAPTFEATTTEIFGMALGSATLRRKHTEPDLVSPRMLSLSTASCRLLARHRAWTPETVRTLRHEAACPACHQARKTELAEPRLARCSEPAVPHSVHQFDLQHEVRALLLLEAAQSARRPDLSGDRGSVSGTRADRESQPVRRRALPAQGVRRNLPSVHQAERGERDLRSDECLGHAQDDPDDSRRASLGDP